MFAAVVPAHATSFMTTVFERDTVVEAVSGELSFPAASFAVMEKTYSSPSWAVRETALVTESKASAFAPSCSHETQEPFAQYFKKMPFWLGLTVWVREKASMSEEDVDQERTKDVVCWVALSVLKLTSGASESEEEPFAAFGVGV